MLCNQGKERLNTVSKHALNAGTPAHVHPAEWQCSKTFNRKERLNRVSKHTGEERDVLVIA